MEQQTNQEQVTTETKTDVAEDTNTNTEQTVDTETKVEVNEQVETEPSTKEEVKTESKENNKDDIMIPKKRFDEINNKYKQLAQQIKDLKNEQKPEPEVKEEVKEEPTAKEEVVNPKLEALEKQVEGFQTVIKEMYDSKLKSVPEEMQELIPEGLTVEQKLSWINKAEEKGLFKKQTNVVIGQPLNHSSEQEKKERIKKLNPLQLLSSYYGESK